MAEISPAAQAVIDYIRKTDHVTFVEIKRVLTPFIEVKGYLTFELADPPNIILWAGMSQAWIDVMMEIQQTRQTTIVPTGILTYMADGGLLNFPLGKRPPKHGYKKPHWVPVCFRPKEKVSSVK